MIKRGVVTFTTVYGHAHVAIGTTPPMLFPNNVKELYENLKYTTTRMWAA